MSRAESRSRLGRACRDLSLILLNTLVLLLLSELALVMLSTLRSSTLGVGTGSFDDLRRHYLALSVYRDQEWAEGYWEEVRDVVEMPFQPFLTWRTRPFDGRHLRVDSQGIRHTPGSVCEPADDSESRPFEVWVFGGSTVWGWGAADHGTLPAYLGRGLASQLDRPTCVVNLGENGYVASQGLLRLEERLRQGHRPDLVLFYDGVNDVMGAYHDGRPGAHQNLALYRRRWEQHESPLRASLARLELSRWLGRVSGRWHPEPDPVLSAEQIRRHHLGVVDTIATLGRGFDFRYHAFWQPHITTGAKVLSGEEEPMGEALAWTVALEPPLVELFRKTAESMGEAARDRPDLTSIVDVFDNRSETVWIDTWGHVGPEGNALIARRMLGSLDGIQPETDVSAGRATAGAPRDTGPDRGGSRPPGGH